MDGNLTSETNGWNEKQNDTSRTSNLLIGKAYFHVINRLFTGEFLWIDQQILQNLMLPFITHRCIKYLGRKLNGRPFEKRIFWPQHSGHRTKFIPHTSSLTLSFVLLSSKKWQMLFNIYFTENNRGAYNITNTNCYWNAGCHGNIMCRWSDREKMFTRNKTLRGTKWPLSCKQQVSLINYSEGNSWSCES